MISVVASAILPIILHVIVGFGLAYRGFLDEGFLARFSQLTFRFFIPCLLFASIYQADVDLADLAAYWSGYFIPLLILFGLITFIKSPIFALTTTYANTVMVGIPLVLQTWGNPGLDIAIAVISLNSMTLFFTYAVAVSLYGAGNGHLFWTVAATLKNPIIVSLVSGILLNMLGIPIFAPLLDFVALAGRAGLPCALLVLGATLSRFTTTSSVEDRFNVLFLCLLKLLLIPAAVYLFAIYVLNLSAIVTGVLVLLAACPSGINVLPFAQESERESRMVSASIFVSTIVAMFILPIWVYVVG